VCTNAVLLGRTPWCEPDPLKEIGVPVDPAALVRNVSSLAALDAEQDLSRAIQQIVSAAEISAAQVYAALAATLLSQAVAAQVKGRLAEQLQVALEHRNRIERAKGMLMVREGLDDAAAFERLRSTARSSRRPLVDVVNEVLGGQRLPRR
jgi:AmiR/NasT family two-component response regulator